MKRIILPVLTVLLFSLFSCQNQQNTAEAVEAEQALFKEVMDIHDEVMPKMGEINRLSRELKSYQTENEATISEELYGTLENALRALEKGDDGMMGWMANIKQPTRLRDTMDHTAIMQYLEKEKAAITDVKANMLKGIEMGNEALSQLPEAKPE